MKCYFRSIEVGAGDCNVIRIVRDDESQFVIMVDCGKYNASVRDYVRDTLHNHIDLLIATHIDGDHIQGLTRMLKEHEGLTIGEIWYNSYGRTKQKVTITLTEQQMAIIRQIQKELPLEFDAIHYREISAEQGCTLAKTILANEAYKNVWVIKDITTESEDYIIPEIGKIVILSPHPSALKAIEKKFKDTFDKYFMQTWKESIANSEELFELLVRLTDAYACRFNIKHISAVAKDEQKYNATYVREQAMEESSDHSDTNYSSIAFMLECGGHKIAMLGDAFASTITDSIDKKYKNNPQPIECEAIKVSHRGSNGNNSRTLYERINSHLYFIPGGKSDQYPSIGTLGRIAEINKDSATKRVVFSLRSDNVRKMEEMEDETKRELGIETIISDQEHELFEW